MRGHRFPIGDRSRRIEGLRADRHQHRRMARGHEEAAGLRGRGPSRAVPYRRALRYRPGGMPVARTNAALKWDWSAVSRQVADLEARLGARLLYRSASGVALTEEGATFLDAAREALAAADGAIAELGARRGEVAGGVRLGCSVAFGRLNVVPRLAALLSRHPGLSIDLHLADAAADLVQDGLDATIRIGVVTDPELVVRRIGLTRRVVVASPDYLARAGRPDTPEDLARHECLLFSGLAPGTAWPFEGPEGGFSVPVAGRFRANSSEAMREAVLAGLGIYLAPLWRFAAELRAGQVVSLLDRWTPTALPIQAVLPSRRQVPARVRAVVDHLAAEFRLDPALSDHEAP